MSILFLNGLGKVLTLSTNLSTAVRHIKLAWMGWKNKQKRAFNESQKWGNIASCGIYVILFPGPSIVLTMCLSNKKEKTWNFWTSSGFRTEKNYQYFVEITEYSHSSFLAWPHDRVKLWRKMIDTLIIRFRHFDWISAVSRKVLTFLESELQHFETLRFLWQLSTTSHMKQDLFTHKLVSSALNNNNNNQLYFRGLNLTV